MTNPPPATAGIANSWPGAPSKPVPPRPGVADETPIFVLGMLQRTGTNYLSDLFELHRDVLAMRPIFEDHLVRWSPHLVAYADDVSRCWTEDWDVPPTERDALLAGLGAGVTGWMRSHSTTHRMVTKMPSVESAQHFAELFPESPLVVLVRDGRNFVESGVRSFGWSYERAMRRWNAAAAEVLALRDQLGDRPDFAIVRYEDIHARPDAVMQELCGVCGLDPDGYPPDAAASLPVRGSSNVAHQSGREVHWDPVAKDASFRPDDRWADWTPGRHRRFAEVAGPRQLALGYELVEAGGRTGPADRVRQQVALADVRWREARVKLGRARRAVRRVHGRI